MKKCFGYIRVSTAKQGEGVSLEAQREAIEGFADRNNLQIIEWYEEKETAAKSGRPVFNAMVKALKAGKASGMIIHRIDRSSRNLKDWALIGELSDAGIDVYFATETLDFRSRGGRLTADIQAVIAADYIRNLRIETRKGINGRLKQGLYPWPAPLGYLDNGSGKPKTLDPVRAPMVRKLFELYLTGNYSIRVLHKDMIERGLTTKGNRPVPRNTVHQILGNPFYCGLVRNGRTGEQYPGIHEKLISVADFERVAEIKAGRYVKKKTKHCHLLRRLFWCENCNAILTPEKQKENVYYRCHTEGCAVNCAREDILEAAICRALKRLEFSEKDEEKVDRDFDNHIRSEEMRNHKAVIRMRVVQAEERIDRLTDLMIEDKLDRSTYERKRDHIQIEIARLKEEEENIEKNSANITDVYKFLELMKNLAGLYKSGTVDEKRFLVDNCFSNRTWSGKKIELKPSSLIQEAQNDKCVQFGSPISDKIRGFIKMFDKPDTGKQNHEAV